MVKTFLGNIKGDKGDPGEPGGFNGESIGIMNMIDISKLTARGESTPITNYEIENGVVHYSNVAWYIRQNIVMNGVKHVFRVEDYLTNPDFNNGTLQIFINDLSGELVKRVNVNKKETVVIDMTGLARQTYDFQLRISNTKPFSGFIEKPMLVEGDHTVLWNAYNVDSNFHLATINNHSVTGTLYAPTVAPLSNNVADSTQEKIDNKITIEPGIWQVSVNTRFNPINFSGSLYIQIYVNEEQILLINMSPTMLKEKSFTHIFRVTEVSNVSLRTGKPADTDELAYSGTVSNKFTLVKLGGV